MDKDNDILQNTIDFSEDKNHHENLELVRVRFRGGFSADSLQRTSCRSEKRTGKKR